MIAIINDALSEHEREEVKLKYFNQGRSIPYVRIPLSEMNQSEAKLLAIAGKFIDLSTTEELEAWTHIDTKPDWHYDKNEELYQATGEFVFPLGSIVYYPVIEDLVDGEFIADGISVQPVQNRMLVFKPGLKHSVRPYTGTRFSFILNPWPKKI